MTLLRRVTGAEARTHSDAGLNVKMPLENEGGLTRNTLKLQNNICLFLQLPFVGVISRLQGLCALFRPFHPRKTTWK